VPSATTNTSRRPVTTSVVAPHWTATSHDAPLVVQQKHRVARLPERAGEERGPAGAGDHPRSLQTRWRESHPPKGMMAPFPVRTDQRPHAPAGTCAPIRRLRPRGPATESPRWRSSSTA
jgi:hypothetical protein